MEITRKLAQRVDEVVRAGLVRGVGEPVPSQMCVEAAVCYALGEPHGDAPSCVGSAVRAFKIRLNDAAWPSNEARAQGMRKLAIAQLGSDSIDQQKFAKLVTLATIREVLAKLLRVRGFATEATVCERVETLQQAHVATKTAKEKLEAAYAAYAADAAAYAAYAADAAALNLSADIGLRALIALKSPGTRWLDIVT